MAAKNNLYGNALNILASAITYRCPHCNKTFKTLEDFANPINHKTERFDYEYGS